MPNSIHYRDYKNILIEGDYPYIFSIIICLHQLSQLSSGTALLADLDAAGKQITIKKETEKKTINRCSPTDVNAAKTLFAKAIDAKNAKDFLGELSKIIKHAFTKKGMKRRFVESQLFKGLSPIHQRSVYGNVSPSLWAQNSQDRIMDNTFKSANDLLRSFIRAGRFLNVDLVLFFSSSAVKQLMGNTAVTSDLQRIFRSSIEDPAGSRGPGSPCTVYFDPDKPGHLIHNSTSVPPMDSQGRPPVVGLAHEFVHTLRAVNGLWTTDVDIEEGLAMGIPPFHFEKFSENLFRVQYGKASKRDIPLRYFYQKTVRVDHEGYRIALSSYLDYLYENDPLEYQKFVESCMKSFIGGSKLSGASGQHYAELETYLKEKVLPIVLT